jgi:Cys-tRNA(Pro) deacylase
LDQLHLPYRLFVHPQPPESLEQAARERGQEPGQVIRSILFRKGAGDFFLVLMAGPGQISWRALRNHLGVSRISLATEAEVLSVTGYAVGTVSPLGLSSPVRMLADGSVFQNQEVSIGSGQRGVAILLRSQDLLTALGRIETGSFA